MTAATGFLQPRAARSPSGGALEPGAVLAMLDHPAARDLPPEAASAWDAAWIACLTNSPRWAETARREFAGVVGMAGGVPPMDPAGRDAGHRTRHDSRLSPVRASRDRA